jgi:hypothetical protein
VVLALTLVVALAACDDNGSGGPTTSTAAPLAGSTSTSAEPATSSTAAGSGSGAALATDTVPAQTLGAGWQARPAALDATETDAQLVAACPAIGRRRTTPPIDRRDRVLLVTGRAPLPTVTHDIAVYADPNDAADAFNALAGDAMLRCLPDLVAAGGLELFDISVTRTPVSTVGDATASIRVQGATAIGGLASVVTVELLVAVGGPVLHLAVITASDLYPFASTTRDALVTAFAA